MSDRVRDAVLVRAKQARVMQRLNVIRQLERRYNREYVAYQNDLKDLVNGMLSNELAEYHRRIK
jgi:hypothetical protein